MNREANQPASLFHQLSSRRTIITSDGFRGYVGGIFATRGFFHQKPG
jgi:hypothetical protein